MHVEFSGWDTSRPGLVWGRYVYSKMGNARDFALEVHFDIQKGPLLTHTFVSFLVSDLASRLVDSIAKGVPPEAIAPRLRDLEAERGKARQALEMAQEADNVIALHPRALTRYKAAIATLAEELAQGDAELTAGAFAVIRELVTAIVVHAAPSDAGGDGKEKAEGRRVRLDIKGRLAAICGNPEMFPNISVSGGLLVAGERYHLSPHQPNPRYLIQSFA
ncbi:hypothetical protein [Bradyrhizobium sp. SZCCHNR2009]|uniref:hypothetical protein n=1 Tax=Bradyrhizobium sp. SZCCHNR2009 TaxID=3057375 RepID=UPI0028E48EFB|nr:hypothetical protein [Bradyrhizobium sp. SZCCHNR2009]